MYETQTSFFFFFSLQNNCEAVWLLQNNALNRYQCALTHLALNPLEICKWQGLPSHSVIHFHLLLLSCFSEAQTDFFFCGGCWSSLHGHLQNKGLTYECFALCSTLSTISMKKKKKSLLSVLT